ncbi:hypothetical protein HPO96_21775 [Kribbella sandramycini]|uniref:Uncharacterized protein n=1 Tax=Kribbella sandramycini TaxID=60450 RepID=A0A7Y4L201_9ACTN|nr:hypothetical protein [Kribbella sandramycini]MBB6566463.1 hypothetical protein [Kribbella sandramycini]NOL42879.1 hypothetical protein [Kribbella sandramycini]
MEVNRTLPKREQIGAWLLLLGTSTAMFGLVWDVQWHSDVGPDTFFTLPHLLLYLGSAISGVTSLTVVLLSTRAARQPQYVDGTRALTVFGTFRAPLPFLICGSAGAVGLLFGLTDLWWHEVYGFDVTPTSPPHVGMSLMWFYDSFGLLMAFTMLRSTRAGRIGLLAAASAVVPGAIFLSYSTPTLPGVNSFVLAVVAVSTLLIALVAGALRRPGPVAAIAAVQAVWHAMLWFFAPVVTRWYADSLGLGLRDFADQIPSVPVTLPFALPVAALVFAGGLVLARRWSPRVAVPALGAVAGLVIAAGYLPIPFDFPALTVVVAAPVGALTAWLGWMLGSLGRAESSDVTIVQPVAPARLTVQEA